MTSLSRRKFIRNSLIFAAAAPAVNSGLISSKLLSAQSDDKNRKNKSIRLTWVDGKTPSCHTGTAFGVPWPMGYVPAGSGFVLKNSKKESLPVESWVTAVWPDGSIKWTGHSISSCCPVSEYYTIEPGIPPKSTATVYTEITDKLITIDTGIIRCRIERTGKYLISDIERNGLIILRNCMLTGMRQDSPDISSVPQKFESYIESAQIEQKGTLRTVVKITGFHECEQDRRWLPFTIRLYFHAESDAVRMVHTFIFNGDENHDFIRGLGIRFNVPLYDELYNRHIRFSGQNKGLWGEAVQPLTGLRRYPGPNIGQNQYLGKKVPDIKTWDRSVSTRMHWIPAWGDFTLTQPNANGFTVKKRTKQGYTWINADQGNRSNGLGYVGGPSGGIAFGMRDFWKLHPTQIDIRNAASESAEVTQWIWSPESPPMDIRFYHDGLGQDIEGPLKGVDIDGIKSSVPESPYAKQLDALNITYEDYEPGFGTPQGIARSTDFYLFACESTPSRETLAGFAESVSLPPQLAVQPEDFLAAGVFSNMWGLPDRSSNTLKKIEDRLDWSIRYYHDQVEQRHWYGFWDYGDVMHTYDAERHVWRYDIGGYAWDNSELSTDMWLWYSFLRSGDKKAFRLAEAMNRHNRDVDIYHAGRFRGLGTRHNVQHWGCSAKQLRISTSMNRRFHYYITTDERTGDVLWEVLDADKQLANINPVRKLPGQPFKVKESRIGVGTDWGSAVSNWLTAWERTGDPKYRAWIENSMRDIGKSKWGFFTDTFAFDIETKKMTPPEDSNPGASHLSTMFGLPEVCAELIQLLDVPEFYDAWIKYCMLYNAPREEQKKILGEKYRDPGFVISHSRITAWAAAMSKNRDLAKRAVKELLTNEWGPEPELKTRHIGGPFVLNPIDEAAWVSTNDSAQWGLAAIQVSALVTDAVSIY